MDEAVYDKIRGGYRVFIGDLGSRIGKDKLEKEFKQFGPITDTWVARNPPGFAFMVYKYPEDAESAVRKLHGRRLSGRRIRVEHARPFEERRRLQQEARRDRRPRYSRSRSRDRYRSRSRDRKRSRDHRSRSRDNKRSRSRSHSRTRKPKKSRRSRSRSRSVSTSRKRTNSRRSSSVDRRSRSNSPKVEKNGNIDKDRRSPSVTKSDSEIPSSSKRTEDAEKTNDKGDVSDD
ncbi:hypothetical protein ACF0H5_001137 [Mactra antiquata]